MRQINLNLSSILLIGFFAMSLVTFNSCSDDEVTGCTDANAENFNAEAVMDDGTCVYARDKFLGDFFGSITCAGALASINTDSLTFTVAPGLGTNVSETLITLTSGAVAGATFTSTVSGNNLDVDATLPGVPLLDITGDGVPDPIDLEVGGAASMDAAEVVLSGNLNIAVKSPGSGATLATDVCAIEGTKQ